MSHRFVRRAITTYGHYDTFGEYCHKTLLRHLHPVLSVPGLTIAMLFSTEHATRQPRNYRRCRTVLLAQCCNSGRFVTHNLCWNHYTGFQYLSESTSTGNLGFQDTVYFTTWIPSSADLQSTPWFIDDIVLINSSSTPSTTYPNWQPCF